MRKPGLIFIFILIIINSLEAENFDLIKIAESKIPDSIIVPDLGSITIDSDGNVFAFAGRLNGKECFVVKFDNSLNYLLHFGRDGQGPGEFNTRFSPPDNRLSINPQDNDVYIIDHNPSKLVVYDNSGTHKKDIVIGRDLTTQFGYLSNVKVINSGSFIAECRKRQQPVEAIFFQLDPPKILVTFPLDNLRIDVNNGSSWITGVTETYYGDNHFIEVSRNHFLFGNSQRYRFVVYDLKGNIVLNVEDPKKEMGTFRKKELEKIGDGFSKTKESQRPLYNKFIKQVKTRKNVIASIRLAGDRVFVFPVREDITIENKYPVEIYDLDGKVIKRGFFQRIPDKIWKNIAFFKEYDKEYNPLIIMYQINGLD